MNRDAPVSPRLLSPARARGRFLAAAVSPAPPPAGRRGGAADAEPSSTMAAALGAGGGAGGGGTWGPAFVWAWAAPASVGALPSVGPGPVGRASVTQSRRPGTCSPRPDGRPGEGVSRYLPKTL